MSISTLDNPKAGSGRVENGGPSAAAEAIAAYVIIRAHYDKPDYMYDPKGPRCKRCGPDGCAMLKWAEAINERGVAT